MQRFKLPGKAGVEKQLHDLKTCCKGALFAQLACQIPVLLLPTTAELCAACALVLNPAIADLQKLTGFSRVGKGVDLVLA